MKPMAHFERVFSRFQASFEIQMEFLQFQDETVRRFEFELLRTVWPSKICLLEVLTWWQSSSRVQNVWFLVPTRSRGIPSVLFAFKAENSSLNKNKILQNNLDNIFYFNWNFIFNDEYALFSHSSIKLRIYDFHVK